MIILILIFNIVKGQLMKK